jgi:hypothetical protein
MLLHGWPQTTMLPTALTQPTTLGPRLHASTGLTPAVAAWVPGKVWLQQLRGWQQAEPQLAQDALHHRRAVEVADKGRGLGLCGQQQQHRHHCHMCYASCRVSVGKPHHCWGACHCI